MPLLSTLAVKLDWQLTFEILSLMFTFRFGDPMSDRVLQLSTRSTEQTCKSDQKCRQN